jgi:drug/metabolite transporter (DMT)-like permease
MPPVRTSGSLALLALALAVLLWGSAFTAIRQALTGLSPAGLSLARLAVASAALGLLALVRRPQRPDRRDWPRLLAAAVCGMSAYQLLLNTGEREVEAGPASILINTSPIFVALLAGALLGERVAPLRWTGITLAFVGASLIGLADEQGDVRLSVLIVLGAALAQAAFFLLQKPLLARHGAFDLTCWTMWLGTLLLLPIGLPALLGGPAPGRDATAATLYLGLGPSAVGFVAWAYAIGRMDVSLAAGSLYLTPLVAFTSAWLLLGETPQPLALTGGGLTLAGVALIARSCQRLGLRADRLPRRRKAHTQAGAQTRPEGRNA